MISAQIDELRQMADGQATYRDAREVMLHAADTICELRGALQVASVDYRHLAAENAKLREQMERLVTLLRNDCDIDASWDGLRRFWSIGLTEGGCLMRDRACKAEAENAKLQASNEVIAEDHAALCEHNAKLREFAAETWELLTCNEPVFVWKELREKARELGVEVKNDQHS